MAGWIKKHMKMRKFMGVMKDQVLLGRAMTKTGQFSYIDLAVLRATGHEEQNVENESINSVLEVGVGSRMRVSHCVRLIMDRLNKTHSWIVALKCLLLIHRCLYEGGFMFQDQLSTQPSRGGHNYLNLSKFKDTSSPFTWATSAWIRWYARYIEQWIQTSRSIGIFLDIKRKDKSSQTEKLMLLANSQLVEDIMDLEEFLHEAAGWEAEDFVMDHALVKKALCLITVTTRKAYSEIKSRFQEVTERISTLLRTEALALLHVCEALSEDSMSLITLCESGECSSDEAAGGQVVYTGFELEKQKEILRLASVHNVSMPSEEVYTNQGLSQPWRSARWEKMSISKLGVGDARRGKSLSEFNFHVGVL